MKGFIPVMAPLLMVSIGWLGLRAQDQEKPGPEEVPTLQWSMQQKLVHAQGILGALAMQDFPSMAEHAQKISLLTMEDNWRMVQTPEYLVLSNEFRRTLSELGRTARSKNQDGASLKFLTLVQQCLDCHAYIRER